MWGLCHWPQLSIRLTHRFAMGFARQNWKPDQSERLLHLFSSSMHIQHHYPTILESACDVDSLIWLWYQGTTIWSHLAASVRPFWKFSTLGPSKNKLFAPCAVAAGATSPRCFETTFSEHMMHSLLWSFNWLCSWLFWSKSRFDLKHLSKFCPWPLTSLF